MGILLRWSYGSFRHWKINGEVMEELKEETFQTEYEIIDLIRMRLYQHRHGLAAVLGAVEIRVSYKAGMFETDGKRLNLDAVRVRERFLEGNDRLCLDILHMLCHCLLGHLCVRERKVRDEKTGGETDTELDLEAWKLAEQIWGLKLAFGDQGESTNGRDSLSEKSSQELLDWWMRQSEILKQEIKKKKPKAGMSKRKRVSRRLISSSGHRGDYRTVLQGFSAFREESGINQEEFQYSWYLYGLENYGNMPMIEPLEYREERKISDLVIVLDTSGSCEPDLVRIFLEETKGILEQDQLFFRQFCLYLIQCDNQIQRDDRIENREQFEEYLEHLEIQGTFHIPVKRQRPVLLIGPPGIGKTAIMEQIARECSLGLVSYTMTHHTRQSAIGLPVLRQREFQGKEYTVTAYTMSEIIASVYEQIEQKGCREGI